MTAEAIAARFASALDADDYATARLLLAPGSEYDVRGTQLVGADAILESYRTASECGKREFARLTYSSRVVRSDAGSATIEFADHIEHGGASHTFRSHQHLTIADGAIVAIRHEDLPGEREKLAAFRAGK